MPLVGGATAGGAARAPAQVLGRGVTADSITVGLFRNKNLGAGYAAFGIAPADPDARKQVLIDDLNARAASTGARWCPSGSRATR